MRVLAVDPALRHTGYAVLEQPEGSRRAPGTQVNCRSLAYGVIKNPPKLRQSACLLEIRRALSEIIAENQPEVCAVEAIIYVQSHKTAITMGAARAAFLIAATEAGLPVCEYAPKRVKQAVVGLGGASKDQVAFMMRALLGLRETPPPDAADALAIGLTHLQASPFRNQLGQEPDYI